MEIVCNQTMDDHLMSRSVYFCIPLALCSFGLDGLPLAIPAAIGVVIFGLGGRFVKKLRIEGDRFEIDYIKFFHRRTISFNIADTVLMIKRYNDRRVSGFKIPRGPVYEFDWLHVFEHGKEKFHVDSRKGFTAAQFMELLQAFAEVKAKP